MASVVPQLRIAELLARVTPHAHLDRELVERYAQNRDAFPRVVVFDTETGLLLVDGYHRVAAAQPAITADVR